MEVTAVKKTGEEVQRMELREKLLQMILKNEIQRRSLVREGTPLPMGTH